MNWKTAIAPDLMIIERVWTGAEDGAGESAGCLYLSFSTSPSPLRLKERRISYRRSFGEHLSVGPRKNGGLSHRIWN